MCGAIAKGALQLVDHQAIAIDAETVLGDGSPVFLLDLNHLA